MIPTLTLNIFQENSFGFVTSLYTKNTQVYESDSVLYIFNFRAVNNFTHTLSFKIRSKYLFLNLVSLSFRPKCKCGNICRQGDSSFIVLGTIDSSPFFVFPGWPIQPMMSPLRSLSVSGANLSSDSYSFAFAITCK